MKPELAYLIITPYSLYKSRTGGILARLIVRTGLELAAARMFAPSAELVQEKSRANVPASDPRDRRGRPGEVVLPVQRRPPAGGRRAAYGHQPAWGADHLSDPVSPIGISSSRLRPAHSATNAARNFIGR